MDPCRLGIRKNQSPLDGNVGGIGHGSKGESFPAEGWTMVDLVIANDSLGVGELLGGEHDVLPGVQTLINKSDRVFLGHGKS